MQEKEEQIQLALTVFCHQQLIITHPLLGLVVYSLPIIFALNFMFCFYCNHIPRTANGPFKKKKPACNKRQKSAQKNKYNTRTAKDQRAQWDREHKRARQREGTIVIELGIITTIHHPGWISRGQAVLFYGMMSYIHLICIRKVKLPRRCRSAKEMVTKGEFYCRRAPHSSRLLFMGLRLLSCPKPSAVSNGSV